MNLTFTTVDSVLAKIDLANGKSLIDLRDVTFLSPFAMVYLGMFLRYHASRGQLFEVNLPANVKAREYLARMKFWERFNFDETTVLRENLLRMPATSSWNDIYDIENSQTIGEEIADKLLNLLRAEEVKINRNLMAELVSELVDNFAQHSDRRLAACMVQYFPNLQQVKFAIGDCGIGIKASLAKNPAHAHVIRWAHRDAALKALEPLVSSKREGGMGLTEVAQGVTEEGGSLVLSTGDGFLSLGSGRTSIGTQSLDMTGVQVEMTFPERR